jgi:hypothetical protein
MKTVACKSRNINWATKLVDIRPLIQLSSLNVPEDWKFPAINFTEAQISITRQKHIKGYRKRKAKLDKKVFSSLVDLT